MNLPFYDSPLEIKCGLFNLVLLPSSDMLDIFVVDAEVFWHKAVPVKGRKGVKIY